MGHFLSFVFAILLVGLVILVLAVVFIVRLIRGSNPSGSPEEGQNEARMIQELYHGFNRMEERIETLETLLLDSGATGGRGTDPGKPPKPEDDRQ